LVSWKRTFVLGIFMLICFTAGVYAADGLKKVQATLRDDYSLKVDGRTINLENSVLVYDGSSYLPVREVGKLLNVKTDWNAASKTIILTSSQPAPPANACPSPTDAGTGSNAGSSTSNSGKTPSNSRFQYPADVKYSNPVKYKVTDNGKSANVFANELSGIVYFRLVDLAPFGIDITDLKTVKEPHSKESYIPAEELKLRWTTPGFEILNDPIIRETDAEKVKTLKTYIPSQGSSAVAHDIRKLNANDEYEILFQSSDNRFYVYKIKLSKYTTGTYYVSSVSIQYLYL